MGTKRDNFLDSTIRILRERVALRCSNPECRVPTSAAAGDESVNNTGIAAHIHAASPGGARYDKSMTKDERRSMKNAIWLCSNCSIKIDRDIERYPAELLHNWRVEAEKLAVEEQGQKLPEKNDAINTLIASYTGASENILSQSIPNIHEANRKVLEALDPRFRIKSQYVDERSLIQLYPQENVPFTMDIKPEGRQDFVNKHKDMIEHGRELIVSTSLFDIKGSKLIEYIADSRENGSLTLSPRKIPAIQRLWFVNNESNTHVYLEDIRGYIVLGTKSFKFTGTAFDGILKYKHTCNFNSNSGTSDLSINFLDWEGQSINRIKYFKKLFNFFEEMFKGSKFFSSLEVNGEDELNGSLEAPKNIENFQNIYSCLRYIEYSREISSYLKIDVKYTTDFTYTYEQLQYIHDIYRTIKGLNKWSKDDQTKNAKTTFRVENAKEFKTKIMQSEPCEIKIISKEREEIELFGTRITLPTKVFLIQNVIPKIKGGVKKVIKDGDIINVEYIPSKNYSCSIFYENNS